MRNRIICIVYLFFLALSVSAQEKGVKMYNATSVYAQTGRLTGSDLAVAGWSLNPGVALGGHWLLFVPVDANIDMYNLQTTKNFQTSFLLGLGAGYAAECKGNCFWDATYSWNSTLTKETTQYQQHRLRFRLGTHTAKGDLFASAGLVYRCDWQAGGRQAWLPEVGIGIRL